MKVLSAYKTELDPNDRQRTALLRHAGAARWAYNFGLRRKVEAYKATGKSPTAIDLHRELNVLKKKPVEDGGVPWMYEISKCAPQEALRHVDRAFQGFFQRCARGATRKGFPRFKSRKRGIGGFTLTGAIRAETTHVQLPRLGRLRLKEGGYLPADGVKVLAATVTERAGRWFVSLQVEQEIALPTPEEHVVGVDVGISALAVTSDGEVFENPKALRTSTTCLRRLQKSVSRKVKGSSNRRKAVAKLARQHYRVACVRQDAIHKATTAIAKQASVVVIESLNVAGMMKNHRLARAIGDAGLAEFHRQLRYKAVWRGGRIVEADRFYPSSKTCSRCGHVKDVLGLGEREFRCESCGLRISRDLNAAINLKNWPSVATVTACGEASAGRVREVPTKLASMKQEPNTDRGLSLIGSV